MIQLLHTAHRHKRDGRSGEYPNPDREFHVLLLFAGEIMTSRSLWDCRPVLTSNPAFKAFRGTVWMPEPAGSCDRREIDWGGCRCQALALTGDARNTDPACHKSPDHERIAAMATAESESGDGVLRWRSYKREGRGLSRTSVWRQTHLHSSAPREATAKFLH